MANKIYKVKGMECPSCASLLECELEDKGIRAKVNFAKETLEVEGNGHDKDISNIVSDLGYSLDG